jgi:alpha-tubulin suppressor-like RCC1 family protein/Tfp pilus assembly protein PilE
MHQPQKIKLGFTIIELMVIVTVVAILAAIGVVSYSRVQANSRDSRRSSAVTTISEALEKYYSDNGEYPSCTDMSQPIAKVAVNVLPGISPDALTAPTAAAGVNSINCSSDDPTSDVYNYVGGKGYVLKYLSDYNNSFTIARSRFGYNLTKIVAESYSTCGISADNHAYCWGYGGDGQLGTALIGEAYTPTPTAVDSSGGAMANKSIQSISAGNLSTCAIDSSNAAYCWGDNQDGQLGDGTWLNNTSPSPLYMTGVLNGKNIKSISTGRFHACAIASDNNPYCWGSNSNGQLGDGTWSWINQPVAVAKSGVLSGKTVSAISAGGYHTCAIASDNIGYCWGSNEYGQLGNNSTTQSNVAVSTNTGALSGKTLLYISAGMYYTCAIANDNKAYCWGYNGSGQLGDNSTTESHIPVAVNAAGVLSGKSLKAISAGINTTCALSSDDKAYCWGQGWSGNLGDGLWANSQIPVAVNVSGVLNGKTLVSIWAGDDFTCVNTADEKVACWGVGYEGQRGSSSTASIGLPALIETTGPISGKSIRKLSSGDAHSCAIANDNKVNCWGSNSDSQLGIGKNAHRITPALIATGGLVDKTIKDISVDEFHSCAIASDDNGYCWGSNTSGEIDADGPLAILQPTTLNIGIADPLYGKTLKQITTGEYFNCAIASDNNSYCWGANWNGQLGHNDVLWAGVQVPVYTGGVLSGKTIKAIDAGNGGACVIASDDKAYCWGEGGSGQNGNGLSTWADVAPVAVSTAGVLSGKTIKQISKSIYHTCVIASDNKPYCWGANWSAQLGNGTYNDSNVPVAVDMTGALNGKTVTNISTNDDNTCVIANDQKVYCWGDNGNGQLGDGTYVASSSPSLVSNQTGKLFKSVAVGEHHVCAITTNGEVYCWGDNTYGQFGNNSTSNGSTSGSNVPISAFF